MLPLLPTRQGREAVGVGDFTRLLRIQSEASALQHIRIGRGRDSSTNPAFSSTVCSILSLIIAV